jgi:hypothetical protein
MHINIDSPEMQAKVEELKKAHGPLRLLQHMGHGVILRRASSAEWEAYLGMMQDERTKGGAMRFLVEGTCAFPERAEVVSMFNALPGLVQTFGLQASSFNGFEGEKVEKKDL